MKKLILICIALIACFATQLQATDYHQSDQLQTHSFVQLQPQILFASFEAPIPVVTNYLFSANLLAISQVPGETMPTNTFAFIDPGRSTNNKASLIRNCNPMSLMYSYKSPVDNQNLIAKNYNTLNYSYGLRY